MALVLHMPEGPGWTLADLDALPDDGLQYELVDGVLLVTPAPVPDHQRAVREVFLVLHRAVPSGVEVFFAPVDFRPPGGTRSLQPDVLVVATADVGPKYVPDGLLLAVEVLSPSTRSKDLVLKRAVYEEAGVASYWVVDLRDRTVTVWDRTESGGAFREARLARSGDELHLDQPYQVVLRPADLFGT